MKFINGETTNQYYSVVFTNALGKTTRVKSIQSVRFWRNAILSFDEEKKVRDAIFLEILKIAVKKDKNCLTNAQIP